MLALAFNNGMVGDLETAKLKKAIQSIETIKEKEIAITNIRIF